MSPPITPPFIGPHIRSQVTGGPEWRMVVGVMPGMTSPATPMSISVGLAASRMSTAFLLAASTSIPPLAMRSSASSDRGVAARRRPPVDLDDLRAGGGKVLGEGGRPRLTTLTALLNSAVDWRDARWLSHRAPAFSAARRIRSKILVASAHAWWLDGMTTQPAASSFAFCGAKFCGSPAVPVIEAITGR